MPVAEPVLRLPALVVEEPLPLGFAEDEDVVDPAVWPAGAAPLAPGVGVPLGVGVDGSSVMGFG